jgi:hypothetical protein
LLFSARVRGKIHNTNSDRTMPSSGEKKPPSGAVPVPELPVEKKRDAMKRMMHRTSGRAGFAVTLPELAPLEGAKPPVEAPPASNSHSDDTSVASAASAAKQ